MKNLTAYLGLVAILVIAYIWIQPVHIGNAPVPAFAKPFVASTPSASKQVAPPPAGAGMSIYGPPTVSVVQINTILDFYGSPARGQGQALYDLGLKYGIDPAFALAFFANESTFGTQGEARATLALGNLRCIDTRPCVDQNRGGYAQFYSWVDGFEVWYQLLAGPVYKGCGLTTVEQIIPKYAPTADNNNEAHYIYVVEHLVTTWRAGKVQAL